MKFFNGVQFLKMVKEMEPLDIAEYFGGKSEMVKFLSDFICTRNFQIYVQKYFNVHLNPLKNME